MPSHKQLMSTVLTIMMTSLYADTSYAKPDLITPVDMSLLHAKDIGYRFVTQRFDQSAPSIGGAQLPIEFAKPRHYQVWLAIPKDYQADNPNNKALYMLDGNAVIGELDQEMLDELTKASSSAHTAQTAPVLVMIGYQTPYRFDINARAYDYTPPLLVGLEQTNISSLNSESTTHQSTHSHSDVNDLNSWNNLDRSHTLKQAHAFKEANRDRLNGGAEHFYQLIEQQIKPWVYGQLRDKPPTEGIWGHSYGGLFVLYNVFEHPRAYDYYFSADPSLWWQDSEIINYWQSYQSKATGLTSTSTTAVANQGRIYLTFSQAQARATTLSKPEFAQALYAHFAPHCYSQSYEQSHGELLPTSLKQALQVFSQSSVQ